MHDQRIDAAADVIDRSIARDACCPGIGIDFNLTYGAAIGKYRIMHLIIRDNRDAILEVFPKTGLKRLLCRLFGQFEEIEGAIGPSRAKAAVVELDLGRRTLQDHGSNFFSLCNELGE